MIASLPEVPAMSRRLGIGWLVGVVAVVAYACGGSGGGNTSGGGASSASGSGGNGGSADASDEGLFVDHGPMVSIVVDPPTATIDVQNGVAAPFAFKAIATYQDQTKAEVAANWAFDRPDIAQIETGSGKLSASGKIGGKGMVTATVGGLSATAEAPFLLHVEDNPAGLSAEEQKLFDNPELAPTGALLYPYDKTVFARGIIAPEIMWSGGAVGDAWLVHLKQAYLDAKVYVKADPPSGYLMSDDLWTSLTVSNAGEDVEVSVARLSGGKASAPVKETWKVAQGSLRGSIYYWAVNTGQLMKIAPGAATPDAVFDSGSFDQLGSPPPPDYDGYQPPWSQGVNNKRCVACHAVSKDGTRIAALFERKSQTPSPWGTIDLTLAQPAVVQMSSYGSQAIFVGISPEGKRVVQNDLNFTMRLKNATTGELIPSLLDGFGDKTADPAFSPDGKLLAFASNITGSYPVEYSRGHGHDLEPAADRQCGQPGHRVPQLLAGFEVDRLPEGRLQPRQVRRQFHGPRRSLHGGCGQGGGRDQARRGQRRGHPAALEPAAELPAHGQSHRGGRVHVGGLREPARLRQQDGRQWGCHLRQPQAALGGGGGHQPAAWQGPEPSGLLPARPGPRDHEHVGLLGAGGLQAGGGAGLRAGLRVLHGLLPAWERRRADVRAAAGEQVLGRGREVLE
jgi:hypothetical protein